MSRPEAVVPHSTQAAKRRIRLRSRIRSVYKFPRSLSLFVDFSLTDGRRNPSIGLDQVSISYFELFFLSSFRFSVISFLLSSENIVFTDDCISPISACSS